MHVLCRVILTEGTWPGDEQNGTDRQTDRHNNIDETWSGEIYRIMPAVLCQAACFFFLINFIHFLLEPLIFCVCASCIIIIIIIIIILMLLFNITVL